MLVADNYPIMKLLVLSIALTVCSAGVIKDSIVDLEDGGRYFLFGDHGPLQVVDSEEPVDEEFLSSYLRNPADNAYWLFTRANPTIHQILLVNDTNSVQNSNFDASKNTVFLAHGWNGDGGTRMNVALTESFLQNDDVNVIVLDWSRLANRNYITAKVGTAAVGKGLGEFVNWLTTLGLDYQKTHLVGFSLGGHLVGNAGRETGGRVKRITALDPAGPLWRKDSNRVVESDGEYVEVIHANTALFGYSNPCGDADFYPNGGSVMPGCFILSSCSHNRAWEYMASTVKNDHLQANECDTLQDATHDRCTGDLNPMGNSNLNKHRSGIFRVNTERDYPY